MAEIDRAVRALLDPPLAPRPELPELERRARKIKRRRNRARGTLVVGLVLAVLSVGVGIGRHQIERVRATSNTRGTKPPVSPVAVGVLQIPAIGLTTAVHEGIDVLTLRSGPGLDPNRAPLGSDGRAVIFGHRTTWTAPFARLNEISSGEEIIVTTRGMRLVYRVTERLVVDPTDLDRAIDKSGSDLVLVTDEPRYSAARRLLVAAEIRKQR